MSLVISLEVFHALLLKRIIDTLYQFVNKQKLSLKIDDKIINEFASSKFVLGNKNCFKDVYSCQAGEIATLENDQIKSKRYFEFLPEDDEREISTEAFVDEFNQLMGFTIQRMIQSAPEVNNWIIPLSGGHDSRIIVNSLKKAGIENVICYSYGTSNNLQSKISKQVAEGAGYPWHFVEYTEEKW